MIARNCIDLLKVILFVVILLLSPCCGDDSDLISEQNEKLGGKNKPNNVDSFNIEVTRDQWVFNVFYISDLKQYRLSVQEYSKVKYNWTCKDKSVQGIIVSTKSFTPTDGLFYESKYSKNYNPSGSWDFGKWEELSGYLNLYIKTYNSAYQYSESTFTVQKYIEPVRNFTVYRNSPYL